MRPRRPLFRGGRVTASRPERRPQPWAGVALAAAAAVILSMLALGITQGSGVTPTNQWVDLYSGNSAFAGVPIPTGAYIAVFGPQNVQCGQFTTTYAGKYGIMPCYGDDPATGDKEGPSAGEPLNFTINGVPATPQLMTRNATPAPAGTPVIWTQDRDRLEVNLRVPPRPPVSGTLASAQVRLDWQAPGAEAASYEVWRATAPYFAPGAAGAERLGTVASGAPLTWSDGEGVGDSKLNYTYRVRSLNASSQTIGISQAVGEFDFALTAGIANRAFSCCSLDRPAQPSAAGPFDQNRLRGWVNPRSGPPASSGGLADAPMQGCLVWPAGCASLHSPPAPRLPP